MKHKDITVLHKRVGHEAEVIIVSTELHALQKLVDGSIETHPLEGFSTGRKLYLAMNENATFKPDIYRVHLHFTGGSTGGATVLGDIFVTTIARYHFASLTLAEIKLAKTILADHRVDA